MSSSVSYESRSGHSHRTASSPFLCPPVDPSGHCHDLSDRLLICASTNLRNEVVAGGSDHALYSVDVTDPRKKPVTMYRKQHGHTDWVTSVAHLADGRVLSGGMDGKLCLWQASRVVCTDLQHDSTHPVSKIVSDLRHNMALTCTYDGTISIWRFEDAQSSAAGGTNSSRLRANVNRASSSYSPSSYLYGHTQPVTECCFRGNTVVSGDKSGSLLVWDLQQSELLHRFRAHPGPITALESVEDGNIIITCGTDGYVKVWDPRSSGTGLVHKIPSHVITTNGVANDGSRAINPIKKPAGRGSAVSRSSQSVAASAQKVVASAIGCMSTVRNRGSASDVTYIVTGSGGADDSSVAVVDMRSSSPDVLCRFRHHRNGVYSMCVVGDSCVLTGDGVGTMLCYDLIHADPAYNDNVVVQKPAWNGSFGESPSVGMENDSCLKYGIGASEKGAVRAINCLSGKVVTAGEDGNVLVFDYISDRVSYK